MSVKDADKLFSDAIQLELDGHYDNAFNSYLNVAHLYLSARRLVSGQQDIDSINKKYERVVDRAQRTKRLRFPGARIDMAEDENNLLDRSSVLNSRVYPLWTPHQHARSISTSPSLSKSQSSRGGTYKRPPINSIIYDAQDTSSEVIQNDISDCSVVASLSACNTHNKRFGTCLGMNAIHPQDEQGFPLRSDDGIYSIRFYFNGAWRSVTINDELPITPDGSITTATTTSTSNELWPALIEKAVMTLWGTYEFSGSNSSTDLQMITGWIPEHIQFHDQHFKQERVWRRILEGYISGICLITLGSKCRRDEMAEDLLRDGFVENHAYAVQQVCEVDGRRRLSVADQRDRRCRAFWLDWEYVTNHFDAIYLSWDPDVFSNSVSKNFTIKGGARGAVGQNPLERCPQYSVKVDNDVMSEVWLLLSRHIKSSAGDALYSAIHTSRHAMDTSVEIASHTNSINSLAKQVVKSGMDVGVVVSQVADGATIEDCNYTLTAYSSTPLRIENAYKSYAYAQKVSGAWTLRSSGGHCLSHSFGINPQYALSIHSTNSSQAQLRLVLEAKKNIPVNVKLLWGSSERVFNLKTINVLGDSGVYTHKLAVLECDELAARDYTVVISVFEANQLSAYTLYADSSAPLTLTPLPQEGSGLFAARDLTGLLDHHTEYRLNIPKKSQVRVRFERDVVSLPLQMEIHDLSSDQVVSETQSTNAFNLIIDTLLNAGSYAVTIQTKASRAAKTQYKLKMWTEIPHLELEML